MTALLLRTLAIACISIGVAALSVLVLAALVGFAHAGPRAFMSSFRRAYRAARATPPRPKR